MARSPIPSTGKLSERVIKLRMGSCEAAIAQVEALLPAEWKNNKPEPPAAPKKAAAGGKPKGPKAASGLGPSSS